MSTPRVGMYLAYGSKTATSGPKVCSPVARASTIAHAHRHMRMLDTDVTNLHATLTSICEHLNMEPPSQLLVSELSQPRNTHDGSPLADQAGDESAYEPLPPESPSRLQAPIDTYLASAQQETASNITSPQAMLQRRKTSERRDLISKGLLGAEDASRLVHNYLYRLDRFLYGLASHYKDVDDIRKASPTLLAAICTVSAFQSLDYRPLFDVCNREFRHLVSSSLFENHGVEHIRALCIGSFWLPDASRILFSDAVRRAADCRLSRNFHLLTSLEATAESNQDQHNDVRDKARLWYLLYICDQHLSVLHNRDPIIRPENDAILEREQFLTTHPRADLPQDVRLMSQVSLLVIMSQIRDVFGCEQNKAVSKTLGIQFSHFSREIDQWFARYSPIFGRLPAHCCDHQTDNLSEPDPYIGTFPHAGLTMHHQFARLYLGHFVLRGLKSDPIPPHFLAVAASARDAAITIFTLILENEAFRDNIIGMPHYFHIMISFAGQFLLEVSTKYKDQLNAIMEEDFRRVSTVVALFARTPVMPRHPIARVTAGLLRKLSEYTSSVGLDWILCESPFNNSEWAAARDAGNHAPAEATSTSFDMPLPTDFSTDFSTDFLYTGFGDMMLPDMQYNYII